MPSYGTPVDAFCGAVKAASAQLRAHDAGDSEQRHASEQAAFPTDPHVLTSRPGQARLTTSIARGFMAVEPPATGQRLTRDERQPRTPRMIRLEHVSKTYGGGASCVHALRDVSLHIQVGELVSIMGPSGSGNRRC